jgi:hypothetical protein
MPIVTVRLLGLTCNNQTYDNLWQTDGQGDEVYVTTTIQAFAPDGTSITPTQDPTRRTRTYGDWHGFPGRVAVDGGQPGIQSGDSLDFEARMTS